MLNFPMGVRMFVATTPTDLRKSYDGLGALVHGQFGMEATSGDLFIFLNRRGTQVRILFWDRDGFCILMKRLERGTFRRVESPSGEASMEIDAGELGMLLEGIDAKQVRRRKRYTHPTTAKVMPEMSPQRLSSTK